MSLLSNADSNAKTKKQLKEFGIEGVIQYMAPDTVADGKHTVCPNATPGCKQSCLYTAGRGAMRNVQDSRIRKALRFLDDKDDYAAQLRKELGLLEQRAEKKKRKAVARLNGTSDVQWEKYLPLSAYNIQFYDYTKSYARMQQFLRGRFPINYDLTFSFSEITTHRQVRWILDHGGNVAVVFRKEIPDTFWGHKVISGMEHDFRYRDPKGVIVGLLARGRAKKDTTGFVND